MQYNQFIDHTLLKSNATKEEIKQLCEEAKQYLFASVCVNPTWVSYCSELLKGSPVKVCTVIGFPLGANTSKVKGFEAQQAVLEGADEVDMVINVGALRGQQYDVVLEDIKEVVKNANGKLVKVIIETCYLTDAEKVKACELAMQAHANFVKTSTGFGTGGATVADVALMKSVVKEELKVKASGGVRTFEDMVKMIEAGASRIGTSSGPKLVAKEDSNTAY